MMSMYHCNLLIHNRLYVVRNLQLTPNFLDCLRQDYTLTEEMVEIIMSQRSSGDRTGKLLDTLPKRGPSAFDRLIFALVETDQDVVARTLDEGLALRYIDIRDTKRNQQIPQFNAVNPPDVPGQGMQQNQSAQEAFTQMQQMLTLQLQQSFLLQQQQQMMQQNTAAGGSVRFPQQFAMSQADTFQHQGGARFPGTAPNISQSATVKTESGQYVAQPVDESAENRMEYAVAGVDSSLPLGGNTGGNNFSSSGKQNTSVLDENVDIHTQDGITKIKNELDRNPYMDIKVHKVSDTGLCTASDVYPVHHAVRGRAVIISNRYFVQPKLLSRHGAEYDEDNLKRLFDQMNFHTELYKDLSCEEIKRHLDDERNDESHYKADMFVLFILTHGAQGSIFGTDGGEIQIDTITTMFDGYNCPALKNKPKLFFIQACQGDAKSAHDETDAMADQSESDPESISTSHDAVSLNDENLQLNEDISEKLRKMNLAENIECTMNAALRQSQGLEGQGSVHEKADMLVSYATVQGFRAWRRSDKGSWFIRCIVYIFSRYACKDHVGDMLTKSMKFSQTLRQAELTGDIDRLQRKRTL